MGWKGASSPAFDEEFLCSGHVGKLGSPSATKSQSWVTHLEHPALLEAVVCVKRSKPQTSQSPVPLQGGVMLLVWCFRIVLGARLSLVYGGDNGVKASLEHITVSVFHTRMPAPSHGLEPGPTLLLGPFQCHVVPLQQLQRAREVQLKVMPSPKGALIRAAPAVAISYLVHLPLFQVPLLNLGLKPLFASPFFLGHGTSCRSASCSLPGEVKLCWGQAGAWVLRWCYQGKAVWLCTMYASGPGGMPSPPSGCFVKSWRSFPRQI